MVELAAAVAIFVAVTAMVLALTGRGSSPRYASVRASERRLGGLKRDTGSGLEGAGLLTKSASNLPWLGQITSSENSWAAKTGKDLRQAGVHLRVGEFLLLRLFVAVIGFFGLFVITGGSGLSVLFALAGAAVGYLLPAFYVAQRKNRRQEAINTQLVEGLTLISNALRSGFAFTQAVELAAKQLQPPLQDELDELLRDTSLGANSDEALRALVERTGSIDIEMIVTTILVQRTTGGNLSEILDNVAQTIRERARLHGEIRALTAQQRLTGIILSVYPFFLGVIFFALSPDLMSVMWEEEAGRILLVIAIVLQVCGAVAIRRILRLDV